MHTKATVISVAVAAAALLVGSPLAQAQPARALTTGELRPLVLTTSQAKQATGFVGTLTQRETDGFRCGRQKQTKAPYCSRIWESPLETAHPSIATVASYATPQAARAQILAQAGEAQRAGTIVERSGTLLVYYATNVPYVGTAAIAQQAIGANYAYAWCSSSALQPTGPAVKCAQDLLAAQVARLSNR